jgi:hypothetical protein
MKKSRSIKTLFMVLMMFYTNHIIAQSIYKNIPPVVIKTFTGKYQGAVVKNWSTANNWYTVKATEGAHKYYATFDQSGKWIMTTEKVNWPWHLPPVIKTAFNNSQYGAWNIYTVKIVEKPSGQFYQLTVDDRNHPVDMFHDNLFTQNRVIEFKSDGEVIKQ